MDIFAGVHSGAGSSLMLGDNGRAVGHSFGAWRIDLLRPADAFKRELDRSIRAIRARASARGVGRVRVAGEPEFETAEHRRVHGIPVDPVMRDQIHEIAAALKIDRLQSA